MKTILLFVIAMTCAFSVQAQTGTTMAQATHALVGPVQSVRAETATFVLKDGQWVEGPRVLQMAASFNEDGNRTELLLYDPKGALVRRIETKFEGRKMLEFLNYDGNGRMWLKGTSIYDDQGQLREKFTYNGDNSLRSKTVFKRNEAGQVIEFAEYSATGTLMEKVSSNYNEGKLHSYERNLYRPDGSLESTQIFDIPNKASEKVTYHPNGSVATKTKRVDKQIAQYDADGSLQKTTLISPHRLIDEVTVNRDGSARRESQTIDELDLYENWIKQTTWLTDSKGGRPLKVTYRVIVYYQK